ncbi:MAG: hypothetical protein Q8Q73_09140 [Stagnimonas sp.]|nr:hypothetical protein [Stagnimonas sp.]
MRKTVQTVALLTACAGVAFAAAPREQAPEARAYLSFHYGQSGSLPNQFFYGLRLDHDRRSELALAGAAPMAELAFDRQGFSSAKLNGLPFTRRVSLAQDEEMAGEGGMFSSFGAVDWTLLAVGAVGIGLAIQQVASGDNTPDSATTGSSTGGGTTGTTTGGGTTGTPTGGTTTGTTTGTPLGGVLGGFMGRMGGSDDVRAAAEYQEWLDGGSGQMGDIAAH